MEIPQQMNESGFRAKLLKNDLLSKFILPNFKFIVIASLFVIISLSILWMNFITSSYKVTRESKITYTNRPQSKIPSNPEPELESSDNKINSQFYILGLENEIRIRPFSGAAIDVVPSNYDYNGVLEDYKFGVGDCNSDLTVCDSTNYVEFANIDSRGGFKFIGTEEGEYKIPISIYHDGYTANEILTIKVSSAFTDADIQGGGYYLTSVYPYQRILEPGYKDYSSSIEFIEIFHPQNDCPELNSKSVAVRTYNPYSCEIHSYRARGNLKVGIVYLTENISQLVKQDGKTLIDYLDNKKGVYDVCARGSDSKCMSDGRTAKVLSFYYVPEYYKKEAKKYGVNDFNLEISSYGVFEVSNVPRYGYARDMEELQKIFNSAIGNKLASIQSEVDFIAYVYIDRDKQQGEKDPFVSTVFDHNLFVNISSPSQEFVDGSYFNLAYRAGNEVGTFAHELGHILGANDKYTQVDRSIATGCRKEGLGNPDQNPLFPQKTTDIYCGKTFESESDFNNPSGGASVPFSYEFAVKNNGVVINKYTAEELGWR